MSPPGVVGVVLRAAMLAADSEATAFSALFSEIKPPYVESFEEIPRC
jgi:hypothetical protein